MPKRRKRLTPEDVRKELQDLYDMLNRLYVTAPYGSTMHRLLGICVEDLEVALERFTDLKSLPLPSKGCRAVQDLGFCRPWGCVHEAVRKYAPLEWPPGHRRDRGQP
jgi:hypothetical protein